MLAGVEVEEVEVAVEGMDWDLACLWTQFFCKKSLDSDGKRERMSIEAK